MLTALGATLIGLIIGQLWDIVLPVLLGLIIATVLEPPATWLRMHRVPPLLAAVIVLLVALGLVGGVIAVIAPLVVAQVPAARHQRRRGPRCRPGMVVADVRAGTDPDRRGRPGGGQPAAEPGDEHRRHRAHRVDDDRQRRHRPGPRPRPRVPVRQGRLPVPALDAPPGRLDRRRAPRRGRAPAPGTASAGSSARRRSSGSSTPSASGSGWWSSACRSPCRWRC